MRKALTLTALMLLSASVSQAKTLEELLVEKGVITKGEAKMAASAPGTVVYNKGVRWDFSDKKFSGQINTTLITRYTYTDADEDFGGKNSSSFDIQQARITASGTVLDKEFSYKVEGDFGTTGGGESKFKDAWIAWNACDWAEIKMGQFKSLLSRQALNSDTTLQFADRSLANDFFDTGRQVGLAGKFRSADLPVTLTAAMFNGLSTGEGSNAGGVDTKHNAFVNVAWDVMGSMNTMEEGDIDGTEDLALNVGASYHTADNNVTAGGTTSKVDVTQIGVNANLKYQGWSAHGEYYFQNEDPQGGGSDVEPQGFYAQVGYFVLPGELELAGRFSAVDCDDGLASGVCSGLDNVNAVDASANYYFWRHQLKAQLGYRYELRDALSDGEDEKINQIVFNVVGAF